MAEDVPTSRGAGGPAPTTQAITTQVMPQPTADPWSSIQLVFGGVVALVLLIGGLMTIADRIMAWRKQGETEDRSELDQVRTEVRDLAATCKDFMPRREIEKGFAHERENRITDAHAHVTRFERVEDKLGAHDRSITELGTEQRGLAATTNRIERMVERMDEKLDRAIRPAVDV